MYKQEIKGAEVCQSKARYDTKEQAVNSYNRFKSTVRRKRGRKLRELKHDQIPYKCEYCGGWHLKRIK